MVQKPQRNRFTSSQDWYIYSEKQPRSLAELSELRHACYKDIEEIRKRPLIVYVAQIVKGSKQISNSIDLDDISGFTDLVNSVESHDKVDVLIHSPGGSPEATERIVYILRNRFKEVSFLIPHSAYSAATMLALSGDEIILHPSATLGPIDPQINGIPVKSIKNGFNKVMELLKSKGPEAIPAYLPLIKQYSLHLFEICDDYEELSQLLVKTWLAKYMLKGKKDNKIKETVEYFSNYEEHLTHSRPLNYEKIKQRELEINIKLAEDELKDLLWEAFILYNGFLGGTPFVKLYESRYGVCWGRQSQKQFKKPGSEPTPPPPPIPTTPKQLINSL